MTRQTSGVRWLVSCVIALLTCPLTSNAPRAGIDPSWGYAVHAWVSSAWGEVPVTSFTYGPLGFLTVPVVWGPWTYRLSLLFVLALHVLLARLVLARLSTWFPFWAAALGTVATMALLVAYMVPDTLLITLTLLAAQMMQNGVQRPRASLAGGVVLAGLVLLVKFSIGTATLVLLLLVVLALSRRVVVAVGAVVAALAVSWAAFGLLTLHPLGFGDWLAGSRYIAQGFPAMAIEAFPDPALRYALGGAMAIGVVAVALVVALRERALVPTTSALVVLLVAYLSFRQGFTRHDEHERSFVATMMFLPMALVLGRRSRWLLVPLVAAPMAYAIWQGQRWDPAERLDAVADQVAVAFQPGPAQASGREQIRRVLPLPAPVLTALQGHRVQVDPYNTAILWAYDLDWGPSDVWALYSSYTPVLDDRNAASISRARGPERILRYGGTPAVDGRSADLESPRYQLTEQCRWTAEVTSGLWQVLRPIANRCSAPTSLGSTRFSPRQKLVVPAPRNPGSIVTVRLELDLPTSTKLWTLAFKPRTERHINLGGRWYRLVVANAGQPLVLRLPAGLPGGARSFAPLSTSTLAVDLPGEAFFEEVAVSP